MGRKKVKGEDIARGVIKRAVRDAARNVHAMVQGQGGAKETRWADVTVQQKASLILAGKHMDAERAKVESSGPKVFAPVFLVPQMRDAGQWERLASQVESTGELPPVKEQGADEVIDAEVEDGDKREG